VGYGWLAVETVECAEYWEIPGIKTNDVEIVFSNVRGEYTQVADKPLKRKFL
jgi:hypothetical protein